MVSVHLFNLDSHDVSGNILAVLLMEIDKFFSKNKRIFKFCDLSGCDHFQQNSPQKYVKQNTKILGFFINLFCKNG